MNFFSAVDYGAVLRLLLSEQSLSEQVWSLLPLSPNHFPYHFPLSPDHGGGVQLQGCCSQSSLNSNSSLPGASSHKRLSERRVASWAACFERLLQDPIGVCYFSVRTVKNTF